MSSTKKNTNLYSTFLKNRDVDPTTLTKELRKKSVQMMSLKERSEHINNMRLPFGVVRCTPNLLLNKWLGMKLKSVIEVGNSLFQSTESSDFVTDSLFTINLISKSEVTDFGFFINGNDIDDDQINNDVLVDDGDVDPFVSYSFMEDRIRNGLSLPKPTLQ